MGMESISLEQPQMVVEQQLNMSFYSGVISLDRDDLVFSLDPITDSRTLRHQSGDFISNIAFYMLCTNILER